MVVALESGNWARFCAAFASPPVTLTRYRAETLGIGRNRIISFSSSPAPAPLVVPMSGAGPSIPRSRLRPPRRNSSTPSCAPSEAYGGAAPSSASTSSSPPVTASPSSAMSRWASVLRSTKGLRRGSLVSRSPRYQGRARVTAMAAIEDEEG